MLQCQWKRLGGRLLQRYFKSSGGSKCCRPAEHPLRARTRACSVGWGCLAREVQAQPDTDSECELAKAEILKLLGKGEAREVWGGLGLHAHKGMVRSPEDLVSEGAA